MKSASDDARWLARAIDLATTNVAEGGGPFGAVIVRGGELVSTGQNRVTRDLDPTAHAEVMAIRAACTSCRRLLARRRDAIHVVRAVSAVRLRVALGAARPRRVRGRPARRGTGRLRRPRVLRAVRARSRHLADRGRGHPARRVGGAVHRLARVDHPHRLLSGAGNDRLRGQLPRYVDWANGLSSSGT